MHKWNEFTEWCNPENLFTTILAEIYFYEIENIFKVLLPSPNYKEFYLRIVHMV